MEIEELPFNLDILWWCPFPLLNSLINTEILIWVQHKRLAIQLNEWSGNKWQKKWRTVASVAILPNWPNEVCMCRSELWHTYSRTRVSRQHCQVFTPLWWKSVKFQCEWMSTAPSSVTFELLSRNMDTTSHKQLIAKMLSYFWMITSRKMFTNIRTIFVCMKNQKQI